MRLRILLVALGLALTAAPGATAAPTARLKPGQAAFWSGARTASYTVDLPQSGAALRVGIDHALVGDVFTLTVTDPGGATSTISPGTGLYSEEYVEESPATGRWLLEVTSADDVTDPRFRVRAKLEVAPQPPKRPVALLPNMQALPPYELRFALPLTNGAADVEPTGVVLPGGLVACHPEEVVEERAVRCLRMAFGVRNTGQGPMQLFHEGGVLTDAPLFQRVERSDGTSFDRPAGVAIYHKTHQHHHQGDAIALQLYAVGDVRRGALTPAGAEHRKGFAHRNEMLREWTRFYPVMEFFGFGLKAGWGDYYEWDRPGNYIDFGTNPDGRYVLRMTADPGNGVLESNERDNTSYSYLEVAGETARLLESGRGRDPWDPCKIVMPFGSEPLTPRPAVAGPARRPAGCAPDTV